MLPTAAENAPRPRLAYWLIAGAVVLAASALLAVGAWFALPFVSPGIVCTYSPWPGPVIRAARMLEAGNPGGGLNAIEFWLLQESNRRVALGPYLLSSDRQIRLILIRAIAETGSDSTSTKSIDRYLVLLLNDPEPEIRGEAALAIQSVGSIPALELHRADSDPQVASIIARHIETLRQLHKR